LEAIPTAADVEMVLTTCKLFAEIAVPIDAFVANANDLDHRGSIVSGEAKLKVPRGEFRLQGLEDSTARRI
jgi:hypothetical protein